MPRFPEPAVTTNALVGDVFSRLARRARERGGPTYPLHVGDTYKEPLFAARAEAQLTAEHPHLHTYAPVQGEPALLDAIERYFQRCLGRTVDRDQLQVMSGATGGLTVVVNALFDAGDEVLLPSPYWPLIRGIFAGRGVVPVEIPVMDRVDERVDFDSVLRAALTQTTAGIYLNTPHNPSGRHWPDEWIEAVARIADEHNLWVLSDETYEELWYSAERKSAVWHHPVLKERCVATHTLSKSYGLAGARVGFTHGPATAMAAIRKTQTYMTYCAPKPSQFGAARALDEGDAWLEQTRRDYAEAGRRASDVLGVVAPEGGTFLFFDAAPCFEEGESLDDFLGRCADQGVLLTPGTACGKHYTTHARLCFTSVDPTSLDAALAQLKPLVAARQR